MQCGGGCWMGIAKQGRLSVLRPMRLLPGGCFRCNICVALVHGCEVCEAALRENVSAKISSPKDRETVLARSKDGSTYLGTVGYGYMYVGLAGLDKGGPCPNHLPNGRAGQETWKI